MSSLFQLSPALISRGKGKKKKKKTCKREMSSRDLMNCGRGGEEGEEAEEV